VSSQWPLIIGHRGASHDAPENTLAAFRLAFAQGADGIEADFRLTRDCRIICMHDETTRRTAGIDIPIKDATLKELAFLDVGWWKGSGWVGERIPTLEDVLAIMPQGRMIFIEIKCGVEIVPYLRDILRRPNVRMENIRLLVFDDELAGTLSSMMSGIGVCLNVEYTRNNRDEVWKPTQDDIIDALTQSGVVGLSSQNHTMLDEQFVGEVRRMGRELHVWTVDEVSEAQRYAGLGVDSLMTNRPGLLKSGLF